MLVNCGIPDIYVGVFGLKRRKQLKWKSGSPNNTSGQTPSRTESRFIRGVPARCQMLISCQLRLLPHRTGAPSAKFRPETGTDSVLLQNSRRTVQEVSGFDQIQNGEEQEGRMKGFLLTTTADGMFFSTS